MKSKYNPEYLSEWRKTHSLSNKDSALFSVKSVISTHDDYFEVSFLDYKIKFHDMSSVLDFINSNIHG